MIGDLLRALPVALALAVVPGYMWAGLLCACGDLAERLAYGAAFSITLVPLVAAGILRLTGGGATLPVVAAAVAVVTVAGLAAYLLLGPVEESGKELSVGGPRPPAKALWTLLPALGLSLATVLGAVPAAVSMAPVALLVGASGLILLRSPAPQPEATERSSAGPRGLLRRAALPTVLAAVAARGYLGPVLYDWPFIRGIDQYTQAIMTSLMLTEGSTEDYLVYPQGFHLWVAAVSRLSGVEPLQIFPVVGPALLLLPALGLYALARRMWGWEYGVAAAAFSGLVLGSSYQYLSEARYPQLIAAQFLTALTVAALFRLLSEPSPRAGISFALLGSSVVFYHHVGSFFLALLLALAGLVTLPYLLLRSPRHGAAVLGSYALLGGLAVLYAWDTYDPGSSLAGVLAGGGSGGEGATGAAVSGVFGTQKAFGLDHLAETLTQPVVWLGVFGAFLLAAGWRAASLPDRLARLTLLAWVALMFAGSRIGWSGFPERFEMDLGVPLSLLAAFATVELLRPALARLRSAPRPRPVLPAVAAAAVVVLAGTQVTKNLAEDGGPPPEEPGATSRVAITPETQAAGEWLAGHNSGGNIVVTPYIGGLPSRAVLAMGGYSAVQTFTPSRIERDRDLPPSGQVPPAQMLWLLVHPQDERARSLIQNYDLRYLVFDRSPGTGYRLYDESPELYRKVFENERVVIFAPRQQDEASASAGT